MSSQSGRSGIFWVQILVWQLVTLKLWFYIFYLKNESKIPILLEFCNIISNNVIKWGNPLGWFGFNNIFKNFFTKTGLKTGLMCRVSSRNYIICGSIVSKWFNNINRKTAIFENKILLNQIYIMLVTFILQWSS